MSSYCLVFALYLNQMSHLTMFPTSYLMAMRTRNQTEFWYIPCRMDTLLFLRVLHCGFAAFWSSGTCCSLFIKSSISACFFCYSDSYCALLMHSSSLQASSWRWRSSSHSWVLIIASLWQNTSSDPCLASFIMQKSAEVCGYLFLSGWDRRASLQ